MSDEKERDIPSEDGARDAAKPSRARLFLTNMLVYGLGGALGKLVPFLMLPVVTRLMPGTEYFGLSDLSNTLVSFCQALAIMGMYDAMFRMFFEEGGEGHRRRVCSTALAFVTLSSVAIALCMLLLRDPLARLFFGASEYSSLVVVSAATVLLGSNNSIVQAPTRMRNRRVTFIVMNLATSVLSYAISIPMILGGEYLLALPVASALAAAAALATFAVLNRRWFSPRVLDRRLLREMLAIGVPLMPTFLFYWVFHSADRLMILSMAGTAEAGVYAVAAKMGQVSQLIYTAFAQGWQYFAFSTMRDSDQVRLNSRVYEYLGVLSMAATAALMVVLGPAYGLMFPDRYAGGATCVPYLFLSPLLLMLFQVASNQLLVVKRTWPCTLMLLGGVAANLLLNWALIPAVGIEGAAVATLAGYLVANASALAVLTRMGLLAVRRRFYLVALAFLAYGLLWRVLAHGSIPMLAAGFAAFAAVAGLLYRSDLVSLGGAIRR